MRPSVSVVRELLQRIEARCAARQSTARLWMCQAKFGNPAIDGCVSARKQAVYRPRAPAWTVWLRNMPEPK
jgi:hypothetical protein